jgi:hypothetical protein
MPERWQRGDVVIVRYPEEDRMTRAYFATAREPVRAVVGWPHIVLSDTDECIAVYMPEGTPLWRWKIEEQRFRAARMSVGASVRLFFPGKRYEVSLFYDTRSGLGRAPWVRAYFGDVPPLGRFHGWKVDIAAPFARTRAGIDMIDEVLDIVVRPDRTHYWRDEDEMAYLIALGIYADAEAEDLRQVGRGGARTRRSARLTVRRGVDGLDAAGGPGDGRARPARRLAVPACNAALSAIPTRRSAARYHGRPARRRGLTRGGLRWPQP